MAVLGVYSSSIRGVHGSIRVYMAVLGCTWQYRGVHGSIRGVHGSIRGVHGSIRVYMAV